MAAPGYHVNNIFGGTRQALSSTYITLARLVVPASSGKRFYIWEIDVGQVSAPNGTDCAVEYDLSFCDNTGAGTKTSATPYNGIDTAVTTGAINYTAEPTNYSLAQSFWHKPINQRGAALWQAAPGGEIFIPSTASEGPGLRALSSNYTGTASASLRFSEV